MPATAVVLASIAAAIQTLIGGTRLWSDLSLDLDYISVGEPRFSLKSVVTSINRNSNDNRPALGLEVVVYFRVGTPGVERIYTEGVRLVHQNSLVDKLWWRAIAGVHEVSLTPDTSLSDLKIEGDIISYAVTLAVTCVTP